MSLPGVSTSPSSAELGKDPEQGARGGELVLPESVQARLGVTVCTVYTGPVCVRVQGRENLSRRRSLGM